MRDMQESDGDDRVVRKYIDLKGRHVAVVEREGVGSALGFSWSSYEEAAHEGSAYLDSLSGGFDG